MRVGELEREGLIVWGAVKAAHTIISAPPSRKNNIAAPQLYCLYSLITMLYNYLLIIIVFIY